MDELEKEGAAGMLLMGSSGLGSSLLTVGGENFGAAGRETGAEAGVWLADGGNLWRRSIFAGGSSLNYRQQKRGAWDGANTPDYVHACAMKEGSNTKQVKS